ncbi:MAG TPA: adenylate/guanylate cyclase domain-containing protein [Nocardioides sp.]|nr:adenylate/guanylate cyclase domain-containing protein [Nocardioides sp.]
MTAHVEPEWAMVTVMFVDVRGFTTFADQATAREAVDLLNEFFGTVVPVVRDHGGHVNKLLGDGLLGVFGAPKPLPNHADSALAAGRDMLVAVEERLGERCRIAVGINTGLVLLGTIGAEGCTELGVIGDPVNVAARVEAATRGLDEPLLVTEATRRMLETTDPGLRLVSRGAVALKGKSAPVVVHGLASRNDLWTPQA